MALPLLHCNVCSVDGILDDRTDMAEEAVLVGSDRLSLHWCLVGDLCTSVDFDWFDWAAAKSC